MRMLRFSRSTRSQVSPSASPWRRPSASARAAPRAQQRGDLAPGKDPAALAGFFVTFMNGLRVAAKTNPDERTLIQRMEAALTVLD
jgi:TetR/AcrR family transcriptional regulator, transcriptional repressor for nem operon